MTSNRQSRGFTLVELMVAITGGLFVSIVVFALARDGARFYQREARVSDATMAALVGFERLRADIGRAGFLSTPNVRFDPHLCGDPNGGSWPAGLADLASLRIVQGGSTGSTTLTDNKLAPDRLVLAGSYTANEQFPVWNISAEGATYVAYLQWQRGPLARLGYEASNDQLAILSTMFAAGRGLRIQDQSGEIQFGTIESVQVNPPRVVLSQNPLLLFRQSNPACGLKGNVTGATINVVNFVQYEVRSLKGKPSYDAIYTGQNAYDADRTELVRVELDTGGNPIVADGDDTEELVAEYAVDLKLGVTVATNIANGTDPTLQTFPPGDPQVANWADAVTNPVAGPHRVRAVRVRLSVRSQEPDREAAIVPGGAVADGLYRIGLGPGGTTPFARVRTLQADIALHNQIGAAW